MLRNALERPIAGWRFWPYGVWALELCLACGAAWGLSNGRSPRAVAGATTYLILCGCALLFPGHLLRRGLGALRLTEARRLLALQLYLAVTAATVIATMAGRLGWWAPLCILASGNALWALELEERSRESVSS